MRKTLIFAKNKLMTLLDKDVSRESTVKYSNREIQVTLTEKQTIDFKLKGMKSGVVSISIENLYKQLLGFETSPEPEAKSEAPEPVVTNEEISSFGNPMISLHALRTHNLVEVMPLDIKVKFESIIVGLLNREKERIKSLEPKPETKKKK